ncbi:Lcl domain-containing protein [Thiothrix fructosivorans]|uniref:DUF1566 domain-containing protein n=1 Tax=Thiothrix fructosivorans TaxID=111770 RepID=A0A8B0SKK7_9GAMM|nr:DUF1566 domain-containing protein [Thiothrix fructosivorans]MBO0613930.1 DUF1566 domain-containing protein [Thiothrix fructosivorans]QTX10297.1 DUF1566 domain-containing protein [Thiothrix fructosivorans]
MNMNTANVHTPNKTFLSKPSHLFLAGLVMSSLLTACGGSSGPSAEELAAQAAKAAAAAQAAADKVAADKAAADKAAALAAQAAAEYDAAIVAARKEVTEAVLSVTSEAKEAQSASLSAGYVALQANQQAAAYAEVTTSLAATKAFASTADTEAAKAIAQKTLAETAGTQAESTLTLDALNSLVTQVQAYAKVASEARQAAEAALVSTRTAAQKVADEVKIAEASKRYTKLDGNGNELSVLASSWSCVKDKNTGFIWEEKTNDGGLRDKDWRYRHMHNSGGYGGVRDTNGQTLCQGLGTCDAYSYMYAVNGNSLCGRNNWRVPLPKELGTIAQINPGSQPPHVDTNFFPETANIPTKGAYCTENVDGAEHNYQGIDFGLPILYSAFPNESPANVLGVSILVPLRFYGEIADGLINNPGQASNWICYTRLVSR